MVTKDRLVKGVLDYIDQAVIPNLPTSGKWVVGTYAVLASQSANSFVDNLLSNPMVSTLGIVRDDMIDESRLCSALSESARKYGKLTVTVPLVGNLTFSESDIDKLRHCISGG